MKWILAIAAVCILGGCAGYSDESIDSAFCQERPASGAAGGADAGSIKSDPASGKPVTLLDDDDDDPHKPIVTAAPGQPPGRYFGGLLDHRSIYGRDFFHDPLVGPDFDSEQQIELDYSHGENRGMQDDQVEGGFEWNVVGDLSVAADVGWESQHQSDLVGGADGDDGETGNARGFEDVDLAVYHPFFQYVSAGGQFDYTAVGRVDVGIPTRTMVSGTDVALTPYVGQLVRIGDHVSAEAWTGWQFTMVPDQANSFLYGVSVGYEFLHDELPLPWAEKWTPIIELDGQTPMSGSGQESLMGVAGFEAAFDPIGDVQPQLEMGFEVPVDQGARDEMRWGIITSVILEF